MALGLALASLLGASPRLAQAQGIRGRTVTCGSVDGHYASCPTGWRDARLVRQDSDTRCVRNQNWGVKRGAIWVDRGCRGQFVAAGPAHGRPGYGPGGGGVRVQCGSVDNRYRLCRAEIGPRARVRLVHQDSDAACRQGYSWGYRGDGIWVDHGCRGQFVVERWR